MQLKLFMLLQLLTVGWTPTFGFVGTLLATTRTTGTMRLAAASPPTIGPLVVEDSPMTLAIEERGISWTSEDFNVCYVPSQEEFCKVRGAIWHLPGKDKMRLFQPDNTNNNHQEVCVVERKLLALQPTYDIYARDNQKWGWMEKKKLSFFDTFELYSESQQPKTPFTKPMYTFTGDFFDRAFVMKNQDSKVVAEFQQTGLFPQFLDAFNHYQVKIEPGMDAGLVVACACAIDEELDEERQEKRNAASKENRNDNKASWLPFQEQ